MAQENKLPFMHRLMYSIYSNQNVPFKFQVDERKYCAHKHIKKAHSTTLQYFSESITHILPSQGKCVHNFTRETNKATF